MSATELKTHKKKRQLKKELRDRINHSDTLLGGRTVAFLVVNGFLMSAFKTKDADPSHNAIAVLGLIITVIWILIGYQTRRSITRLHLKFAREFPGDIVNNVAFSGLFWRHKGIGQWLGPTELVSLWLPSLVGVAWALIIILT